MSIFLFSTTLSNNLRQTNESCLIVLKEKVNIVESIQVVKLGVLRIITEMNRKLGADREWFEYDF